MLDGIVALVTGGASGLGAATVRSFIDGGARIAILDRAQSDGEALARGSGGGRVGRLHGRAIATRRPVSHPATSRRALAKT